MGVFSLNKLLWMISHKLKPVFTVVLISIPMYWVMGRIHQSFQQGWFRTRYRARQQPSHSIGDRTQGKVIKICTIHPLWVKCHRFPLSSLLTLPVDSHLYYYNHQYLFLPIFSWSLTTQCSSAPGSRGIPFRSHSKPWGEPGQEQRWNNPNFWNFLFMYSFFFTSL